MKKLNQDTFATIWAFVSFLTILGFVFYLLDVLALFILALFVIFFVFIWFVVVPDFIVKMWNKFVDRH